MAPLSSPPFLGLPGPESESSHHHSLPHHSRGSAHPPTASSSSRDSMQQPGTTSRSSCFDESRHHHQQPPNLVACLAAVVCIVSLFLPTVGDNTANTIFQNYDYLHLTVNQKLVFAYVLGLVTMAVLRMT